MERRVGRRLVVKATVYLICVRLGLWFASYRAVSRFVRLKRAAAPLSGDDVRRICWATAYAARYVPKASCLTQAIAAQMMLARLGHAATVRVGAARNDGAGFRAHAWLLSGGEILLGGEEEGLADFGHLLDIEAGAR